ncbi:hypothetical protein [Runella slithyformis]|uniref:hypothetical protein n=1 Tax=Runella slithyformis TaxID=106 RepID=UPI00059BC4A9|nr:hypothetical protein [Runella slithyformis]
MIILDHLCSVGSSREIEEGIYAECIINFNKYTHDSCKFDGFYVWELSRFVKVSKEDNLPEIQKKCISSGGEKMQFSLLSKSIPVNIIKISISNEWCQSKGINDIIQTSKFFCLPINH